MLLVSQGVPMILMGDEVGRTQHGNNNTYCHDNELNWFDWRLVDENADLLRFFQHVIAFRHAIRCCASRDTCATPTTSGSGLSRHHLARQARLAAGLVAGSRVLAFMLCGRHAKGGRVADDDIYVGINRHWDALEFELPQLADGRVWHVAANTSMPSPEDCWEPGQEPRLERPVRRS